MVLSLPVVIVACSSEEPEVSSPATPVTATATSADGVAIEYEVRGAGPVALVFIHGWICDRTHWRHQVDAFADGHIVVTLDLAGHGNSGSDRDDWTADRFGADVQAVVEALDLPRVILVGHSMGGQVALVAAARMPERVLGVVGADTLHNVEAGVDPEQWNSLMTMYEADFEGTCDNFVKFMFPEPTEDTGLSDWVRDNMCDADPEIAIAVGRQMPNLDQPAMLAAVGVPVRCINSAKTAVTEIEANLRYGNYDAVLMEGVGHFVMLERPEEFNRLLAEAVEELTGA
jgi:pimeloyl-ACP methyl ester carboxylesterase